MRFVCTQALVARPGGGRTALREFLAFDGALRARLFETQPAEWPGVLRRAVRDQGQPLAVAAERAFAEGAIDEATRDRVRRRGREVER